MTDMSLTVERVLELIDAYGAEPGAWPEDERAAATALIAAQPDTFAAALHAARALDASLAAETLPLPSLALSEAILAQAPAGRPAQNSWLGQVTRLIFPQGARWPAGAALASLVMGLVGGYAYAATGPGYDQADAAFYTAFGFDTNEDWMSLEEG